MAIAQQVVPIAHFGRIIGLAETNQWQFRQHNVVG